MYTVQLHILKLTFERKIFHIYDLNVKIQVACKKSDQKDCFYKHNNY